MVVMYLKQKLCLHTIQYMGMSGRKPGLAPEYDSKPLDGADRNKLFNVKFFIDAGSVGTDIPLDHAISVKIVKKMLHF